MTGETRTTTRSRTAPPFRADHVGSLLRPAALRDARQRRERGEIDADALKAIEDEEIRRAVERQKAVGLRAVTDGEFRRAFWQIDFLENLAGVESYEGERKVKFQGAQPRSVLLRVVDRLGAYRPHPMIDHFRFLDGVSGGAVAKMTIPSPTSLHFRYGRQAVPEAIYPDMEAFYHDLGESYRQAVNAFVAAGCRYLQLDEVNLAYLCDPALREQVRGRGEDPDALPAIYARLINAAIADVPDDVTITMHLCRGNFQSTFVASGGYEPVAEILFNEIGVDGYFMEYDSDRAGGFEPLRHAPKGKMIVLGLVTSKTGALEPADLLRRRIEEAARFVDLDQIAISPQCGFASTEEGNLLDEEQQWAKLRLCVETAEKVWGGV